MIIVNIDFVSATSIPDPYIGILTPRSNIFSIGGPADCVHDEVISMVDEGIIACGRVPYLDGFVFTGGGDTAPIRRPADIIDRVIVTCIGIEGRSSLHAA